MSSTNIPKNTLVVVTTGTEAKIFRNQSDSGDIKLRSDGGLTPKSLADDGPSGNRPKESSPSETDEATFSKQLAEHLYKLAHSGKFSHLVLMADPETLGELRPILHQEVSDKIVLELNKTLVNSSTEDIEKSLCAAIK
ncbi:host attachment family protein [Candidatus Nitrospira salsa]|nr:MAG: host attachment protein [Nitrospirales bacterium]